MTMHTAPIEPAAEDTDELVRQAVVRLLYIKGLCHLIDMATSTCSDVGDVEADGARHAIWSVVHSIDRETDEALGIIEQLEVDLR